MCENRKRVRFLVGLGGKMPAFDWFNEENITLSGSCLVERRKDKRVCVMSDWLSDLIYPRTMDIKKH